MKTALVYSPFVKGEATTRARKINNEILLRAFARLRGQIALHKSTAAPGLRGLYEMTRSAPHRLTDEVLTCRRRQLRRSVKSSSAVTEDAIDEQAPFTLVGLDRNAPIHPSGQLAVAAMRFRPCVPRIWTKPWRPGLTGSRARRTRKQDCCDVQRRRAGAPSAGGQAGRAQRNRERLARQDASPRVSMPGSTDGAQAFAHEAPRMAPKVRASATIPLMELLPQVRVLRNP